ncbi:hypothetical protein Pcinc_010737 [Petrolisthes cinctipes]|uniref:Uncharacterized protein n=1 Tax=Petrolisthes cinctipes TaxID=88211 RepID=A0AAE1G297_PETCI|nr:hypothetical protein Pcinc_010737 [Petrolisthes cinctipes]
MDETRVVGVVVGMDEAGEYTFLLPLFSLPPSNLQPSSFLSDPFLLPLFNLHPCLTSRQDSLSLHAISPVLLTSTLTFTNHTIHFCTTCSDLPLPLLFTCTQHAATFPLHYFTSFSPVTTSTILLYFTSISHFISYLHTRTLTPPLPYLHHSHRDFISTSHLHAPLLHFALTPHSHSPTPHPPRLHPMPSYPSSRLARPDPPGGAASLA